MSWKKHVLVVLAVVLALIVLVSGGCGAAKGVRPARTEGEKEISYTVRKIWDEGTHAAFTSLIKFKGRYYCCFREGDSHIFDEYGKAEGRIRVLGSKDGNSWESVLDTGLPGIDCRDPKFCITPAGRLMVSFGGSTYRSRKLIGQQGYVMFSDDGRTFSEPEKICLEPKTGNDRDWLWRVTWFGDDGYGICYGAGTGKGSGSTGDNNAGKAPEVKTLALYKTRDGINYTKIKDFDISGFPNEATLRFTSDGTMLMMLRRDADDRKGFWGTSRPPYTEWDFTPMPLQIGGPDFLVLEKAGAGSPVILAGTRSYAIPDHCKTILLRGTPEGDFQEVFTLPSDGDTSYPGMLVDDGQLWVSYYSTAGTRGKAAIFLARIPLEALSEF